MEKGSGWKKLEARRHTGGGWGQVAGLVMWCGNWLAGSKAEPISALCGSSGCVFVCTAKSGQN